VSSHREAPYISTDPVADNTDVYAFVSPDEPDTVTIIANFIPLEAPAGGPNFYQFGDDVLYEINISNSGTKTDISYQFAFTTAAPDPAAGFLYNTGPITSLTDATWNRKQTYDVTKVIYDGTKGGNATRVGMSLPCPPCNIGPLSTPDYSSLAAAAVKTLTTGEKVFAGQRADAFFVDLGAVFDLGDLRPFASLHAGGGALGMHDGINTLGASNVHTIALQIPKAMLTSDGSNPTDPADSTAVIGVYASAYRQKAQMYDSSQGHFVGSGPYEQVSRLGMPLFNEVLVSLGMKDTWNASSPFDDSQFVSDVSFPALADLLPSLYPGVFPNLAALNAKLQSMPAAKQRADLVAIFLTGLPTGIVPGFQNVTAGGSTQADLLRLNMAIPPAKTPNPAGLVGGDAAGFPNGRRLEDDIVTIELRALAGVTYPLVDSSYTPDAAASKVTDGATGAGINLLPCLPYMPEPYSGYYTPSSTPVGNTGETIPEGAPQTGGGGAAGLADRVPLAAGAAAVATAGVAAAVLAHHRGSRNPAHANGSEAMAAPGPADGA
jgi:Domain of unknown function (DUF4331)